MGTFTGPAMALELYREGEKAPYDGKYAIVNEEGDVQDYEPIALDAGDIFPERREEDLYYMLSTPCPLEERPIPGTEGDIPPDDLI